MQFVNAINDLRGLAQLMEGLTDAACYDHPVEAIEVVETHISYVVLTGKYAYKVKKPLNLGFLDFSTPERRLFFCEEELRLNGRLAPDLYLGVVPITGSPRHPVVGGQGSPLAHAVMMRQFDQANLLDRMLGRGEIRPELVDAITRKVVDFHERIAIAEPDSPFGSAEAVARPVQQNFEQIRPRLSASHDLERLASLEHWTIRHHAQLRARFAARKADGFIRECHGDMHLGNMALVDREVTIFDGIEFNPALRWIDVMSDVAFLVMDLEDRQRPDLGRRFLNGYLSLTGDYGGLAVLDYYRSYRALVRAKVMRIRAEQTGQSAEALAQLDAAYRGYIAICEGYARPRKPRLILTHGLSGSGKSTWARALSQLGTVIHIRSDVERKRLAGLEPHAESGSEVQGGLYTRDMTERTYTRLAELAQQILANGFSVCVDATFLERRQRARFHRLATTLGIPFTILDLAAPQAVLRERMTHRAAARNDPSEATSEVLERQMATQEPLTPAELAVTVRVDATLAPDPQTLLSLADGT
jgi:aminoglycoside phosphotransferase family enzyme/adenylate kinase family enzyme